MSRRTLLVGLSVGALSLLLGACGDPGFSGLAGARPDTGQAGRSSGSAAWEQVVEGAKKEGVLNLYEGISFDLRKAVIGAFEQAFPNIKVNDTLGPSNDIVARLLAERQAKKLIADVIVGPGTQATISLKPAGVIAPLQPALILPEVLDTSAWLENRLWWVDAEQPLTTISFQGNVGISISYNTKLVDPTEFGSYWDLLNPKWKGQIVAYDVRSPGQGGVQVRFIYQHPELGPKFLERLFREMNVTVSEDHRQMVDWLGQGRYKLGLWVSDTQLKAARVQGLPVGLVSGEQLKEGAPLSIGGGAVNLADSAPHPNAAKLFVNWLLSRAGQTAWQMNTGQPSLRLDVTRDGLEPASVPKPGAKYVAGGTEAFMRTSTEEIAGLVTKSLQEAQR